MREIQYSSKEKKDNPSSSKRNALLFRPELLSFVIILDLIKKLRFRSLFELVQR